MADRDRLGRLVRLLDDATPPASDGELLQEFALRRDEAAFAALVRRYAPLVAGVCRRVLRADADADDAFQVTFLILAAKAQRLRPEKSLACWLAKVAYHVALRARASAQRRRALERQALPPMRPEAHRTYEWHELGPILDDELNRLPEKLRAPLVLCGLQGKTNAEAAAALGWPVGSISRRLAEGRDRLRGRLARQGFTVAATLPFALAAPADAAAPGLLDATSRTAVLFADSGASAGLHAARVVTLAEGVLRAMWLTRVKVASLLLLAAAVIGVGIGLGSRQMTAAEPTAPQAPAVAAESPAPPVDRQADPLPDGAVARLGSTRWRHGGDVHFAQWVAGGQQLLTVTTSEGRHQGKYQGLCRLWDRATGKELRRFPTGDEVSGVAALSPDEKRLALVGHNDGALRIFDVATGRLAAGIPRTPAGDVFKGFGEACFAPDSTALATLCSDHVIRLWDAATGKLIRQFGAASSDPLTIIWPNTIAFSPDGKTIARTFEDLGKAGFVSGVRRWDVATGAALAGIDDPPAEGPGGPFTRAVAFLPDGSGLFRIRRDSVVVLVDGAGKEIRTFGAPRQEQPVARIALSADGKLLAAKDHAYSTGFRVWEVATGKEMGGVQEKNPFNRLSSSDNLSFAPDGKQLCVVAGNTVRLFDVATGKEVNASEGHGGAMTYLAVTPDGRTALSLGEDSMVRRWDLATGQELGRLPLPHWIRNLAVAPDGKSFAFDGRDGRIHLWDSVAGKETQTFAPEPAGKGVGENGLVFSLDGKLLAAKDAAAVHVWNVVTGQSVCRMPSEQGTSFRDLAFSPDGTLLAIVSAGKDNQHGVSLRQATTGLPVREIRPQRGTLQTIAFSPDSRTLALVHHQDKAVTLWETATGRERAQIHQADVGGVAFAPDGQSLAAVTHDSQIVVWDVPTGRLLGKRAGSYWMRHVQFTPDGRRLLTASQDTTGVVWDADPLLRRLPRAVNAAADMPAAWAKLGGDDAMAAWQAQAAMLNAPDQALAILKEALKPAAAADEAQIQRWLAELEDERFAVREQAAAALEKRGSVAEPFLQKALKAGPPLETRQRLEQLLE